ncbi:glycine-rich protein-like [Battus philenor]|uniref:glycine-rich protein-like n=1 Tax=Battus philenor TaxID=42288 RepID=UPI0035D076C0
MKAIVCALLLLGVAYGAEEKKNEKRGLLGLGYGLASAPIVSHGVGLDYGIGLGGHGLALSGHDIGLGYSSLGYGGHGIGLSYGGLGYGHSVVAAAPVISHSVYSAPVLDHGLYGGKLSYGAPLLGLGHGYLH